MNQDESISSEEEIVRYHPRTETGLNREQVTKRIIQNLTNASVDNVSKTVKEIIQSNVFTYFNLIFLIITIVLCIAGSFRDLTFLPIIIANTCIGIIQEIRSKDTLDKLSVVSAPKSRVIRDGSVQMLPTDQLVLDDVVIFSAGNQICADAYVLKGEVQVNESLITGESDEITMRAGDNLLSGSFVVSGECYARLERVGASSYASKLTLEAKKAPQGEQSEMIRSLNVIVKAVGVIIIPVAGILFFQQYKLLDSGFKSAVTSAVAAVIGMIPEGLYLLTSVALAVSVMRLARKKVLVHDMKCIETLARVNVLCVDKTGTITEPEMKVFELIPLNDSVKEKTEDIQMLIGSFTAAMTKDNETMKALSRYFVKTDGRRPTAVTGFSSAYKYSAVTFGLETYIIGAPEFILREDYPIYEKRIEQYSSQGFRVLIFARYPVQPHGKALSESATPLALILLSNPIRKEAKKTFAYFNEQNVEIKVISGDNPVTVSRVAREAGILNADQYVDASILTTRELIKEAITKYTVFGRVTPKQKRQFVVALKEAGNTVAMTGDGVNDVLALKDADCSIAMASGSDVAAQAAQLVLLNSDFSCMPSVVLEGRRVINNIERSASLFLVKNIFSFLMAIFSMIFLVAYPLTPSQISLISMFTIGIPAFLLALENNHNRIQGHFMNNVLYKALPAGLTDFIVVSAVVIFSNEFAMSALEVSTASTLLMSIVGFMILYRISKPMNPYRSTICCVMITGFILCSIYMSNLFNIHDISTRTTMLLIVFGVACESVFRYTTIFINKFRVFYYASVRKLTHLKHKYFDE